MLPRKLVGCILLLAMSVAACGREQPPNSASPDEHSDDRGAGTGRADLIEYVFHDDYESRRLLLTVEGAARIDFRLRAGQRQRASTVLVPTDGKEVERLVGAVNALIESGAAKPVTTWLDAFIGSESPSPVPVREPVSQSQGVVIRCRKGGRDRVVRMGRFEEDYNFVWEGVRKEIEAVGLLELARAVDAYQDAQLRGKDGDRGGAVDQYDRALKVFMTWAWSRCDRYGPTVLFEPRVALSVQVPGSDNRRFEIDVSPEKGMEKIMEFSEFGEDWTQKTAMEFLSRAWQKCVSGMVLSRSGKVIIVAFPEPVFPQGWTWGLPVTTIRSKLVEHLKRQDRWAADGDHAVIGE